MKTETKLARILIQLAAHGAVCEGTAAGILKLVKTAVVKTEEAFTELVKAAYDANGWHLTQGKPAADSKRTPVPATVRTYVWEVRAALRSGLKVGAFNTFYELRKAREALNPAPATVLLPANGKTNGNGNGNGNGTYPPEVAQDLQGVRVVNPEADNGALFHDLIRMFIGLDTEPRLLLERQITRLMHTYQRKAAAPPAAKGRKAASA